MLHLGMILLLIIAGITILAIIGLGWNTFFAGVQKGAEKVGITKAFKNLTNDLENSISKIVKNAT